MKTKIIIQIKPSISLGTEQLQLIKTYFINLQDVCWTDLLGLIPEIYIALIILIGLVLVSAVNFFPKALLVEQKKSVTFSIYEYINTSIYITLLLSLINEFIINHKGILLFNAYGITDFYSNIMKFIILLITLILLNTSQTYIKNHPRHIMEYPIILLLMTLFLLILVSSYNLMTMFMAIIGFSLNIYVLLLFDSFNHASREAGVKYFYLSTFSSGLIISGVFFAYFLFRTVNFLSISWQLHNWILIQSKIVLLTMMLYFIIFGFLFKLAAFPCHLWAPEVYDGSPHPVTAIFVLPIKIAVFALLLRLLYYTFSDLYFIWNYIIWLSSVLSMVWGCLTALNEARIKRFIAYSSINQMGFLLMGIACGTFEGLRSSLIYLLLYIIMNLGFFILFLNTREQKTRRSLTYLTDFNDYAQSNYLYTVTLVIILFSMAGIPPLGGFFGKYYLFLHTFETGNFTLVITGMITSLIGAYYYLRIIKVMWFEEPIKDRFYFQTIFPRYEYLFSLYIFIEIILIWFIIWNPFMFPIVNFASVSCISPLNSI